MTVLIPSVFDFSDSASFFQSLLELNKKKVPPVSGRKISHQLNWPASLIIDIIKKRKPLTLQRASEFARRFGMNVIELERLIWISLMETGDEHTRLFYQAKLRADAAQILLPAMSLVDDSLYFCVDVVANILLSAGKRMSPQEIKTKLNSRKIPLKEVKSACDFIFENEILEWDLKQSRYRQKKNYHFDNYNQKDKVNFKGIEIHRHYAQNFLEFIENPQLPSAYISGCAAITKEQFQPIALQLFQIKNWLLSLSEENRRSDSPDLRLMQFDLHFFKITK